MSDTHWLRNSWLDAILRLSPGARRHIVRGRKYARTGRVVNARIADGIVSGCILGHRKMPYTATITVRPIAEDVWGSVFRTIAATESMAAQLRRGVLPPVIATLVETTGDTLWPRDTYALHAQCECHGGGDSCRHVVALHCWLAEQLDRDPLVLFTLRGCPQNAIARALHGEPLTPTREPRHSVSSDDALDTSDPPAVPAPLPATHQILGLEASSAAFETWREPVPELVCDAPDGKAPQILLAQLGDPPEWDGDISVRELLTPIYRAAASRARELLGES